MESQEGYETTPCDDYCPLSRGPESVPGDRERDNHENTGSGGCQRHGARRDTLPEKLESLDERERDDEHSHELRHRPGGRLLASVVHSIDLTPR